jgi:hypothetical protein
VKAAVVTLWVEGVGPTAVGLLVRNEAVGARSFKADSDKSAKKSAMLIYRISKFRLITGGLKSTK